jgi:hypothetical protein
MLDPWQRELRAADFGWFVPILSWSCSKEALFQETAVGARYRDRARGFLSRRNKGTLAMQSSHNIAPFPLPRAGRTLQALEIDLV